MVKLLYDVGVIDVRRRLFKRTIYCIEYSNGAKVWKQAKINKTKEERRNSYHNIEFGMEEVFFLKDGSSVYIVGNEHNPDGPAYTHPDGTTAWCLDGELYSFDTWCEKTKKTLEEIVILKFKYEIQDHKKEE